MPKLDFHQQELIRFTRRTHSFSSLLIFFVNHYADRRLFSSDCIYGILKLLIYSGILFSHIYSPFAPASFLEKPHWDNHVILLSEQSLLSRVIYKLLNRASSRISLLLYFLLNLFLLYSFTLTHPVSRYSFICLVIWCREYPVTFSIYFFIKPFSFLPKFK